MTIYWLCPRRLPPQVRSRSPMTSTDSQATGKAAMTATSAADAQDSLSPAESIIRDLSRAIDQLAPIAGDDNETISNWRNTLNALRIALSRLPKIIIGFVGATGAGKSSVINAILRNRIVPTSGLKSCTSTPIEVSHHDEDKVKALIRFITLENWLEEICYFLRALSDARGSISKLGEDGKEAWQRIGIIYPELTKLPTQTLKNMTAEEILALDPAITLRLGNTVLAEGSPVSFNEYLQQFCVAGKATHLWPIIAQISIKCNAPVLKNGITLLDLPGVLDSNTARAAIAADHLKRCDRIFVVSPIKRAATDKVAQDLMGDAFRAQLQNGKYSAKHVALIASCCDDIDCTEIVDELSLGDDDEWKKLSSRLHGVREQLEAVKTTLEDLRAAAPQVVCHDAPANRVRDGHGASPLKRSGEDIFPLTVKRPKLECEALPTNEPSLFFMALDQDMPTSPIRSPLNGAAPSTSGIGNYHDPIAENEALRGALEAEEKDLQIKCTRYCIAARNAWTRAELQEQFQCGLDETNEDPDSEEVPDVVHVFTVSARESLRLQGNSLHMSGMPVCQTPEETGVPELETFCERLSREELHAWRDRIAAQLLNLVFKVQNWIQLSTSGSKEDREQLGAAWKGLNADDLQSALPQKIAGAIATITDATSKTILFELDGLAFYMRQAAEERGQTAESHFVAKIAKKVKHHNTLKAVFKRLGRWKEHDWNGELTTHLKNQFSSSWKQVLELRSLEGDADEMKDAIEAVLDELDDVAPLKLAKQLAKQNALIVAFVEDHTRNAGEQFKKAISKQQMNISRDMTTEMEKAMRELYEDACNLPGTGFKKAAMDTIREYLSRNATRIYTAMVESAISALHEAVKAELGDYVGALQALTQEIQSQMIPWDPVKNARQEVIETVKAEIERIVLSLGRTGDGVAPAASGGAPHDSQTDVVS